MKYFLILIKWYLKLSTQRKILEKKIWIKFLIHLYCTAEASLLHSGEIWIEFLIHLYCTAEASLLHSGGLVCLASL